MAMAKRRKLQEVKKGQEVFHLGDRLQAPGEWYQGGRVLRRRLEKVGNAWEWMAMGMALERPDGWYFVERERLLKRPNPWTGPPMAGPFAHWGDTVETFL